MPLPLALLSWLSPVFPTGGFAYSGGLETAVAEERVGSAESLIERTRSILTEGTLWNDSVLIACAHRSHGDPSALIELADMAKALAGSAERLAETCDQGRSFAAAVEPWNGRRGDAPHDTDLPADTPLPVRLGSTAGRQGFSVLDTLTIFLHTAVSAQLQAAIRLSLVGQTGAAQALAVLESVIAETAKRAADADLEDLATACLAAEIDALRHETLVGRLFLS